MLIAVYVHMCVCACVHVYLYVYSLYIKMQVYIHMYSVDAHVCVYMYVCTDRWMYVWILEIATFGEYQIPDSFDLTFEHSESPTYNPNP